MFSEVSEPTGRRRWIFYPHSWFAVRGSLQSFHRVVSHAKAHGRNLSNRKSSNSTRSEMVLSTVSKASTEKEISPVGEDRTRQIPRDGLEDGCPGETKTSHDSAKSV